MLGAVVERVATDMFEDMVEDMLANLVGPNCHHGVIHGSWPS